MTDIGSKRVIDVTTDELTDYIIQKLQNMQLKGTERKLVRGVRGIMEVLGCSRSKAATLSCSGILEDAIVSRSNRLVIYDAELILKLLK